MSYFRDLMMAQESGAPTYEDYIQDGLVFQLDCGTECSASSWTDIIGNKVFVSNGKMSLNDFGVPTFNGSSWYVCSSFYDGYSLSTSTIEVAYRPTRIADMYMFYTPRAGTIGASIEDAGYYIMGPRSTTYTYKACKVGNLVSLSYKDGLCVENEVELSVKGSDYWSLIATNGTFVGYMAAKLPFYGEIYAIRVYNRHLTKDEMLENQAIDLERFADI